MYSDIIFLYNHLYFICTLTIFVITIFSSIFIFDKRTHLIYSGATQMTQNCCHLWKVDRTPLPTTTELDRDGKLQVGMKVGQSSWGPKGVPTPSCTLGAPSPCAPPPDGAFGPKFGF